MKIACPGRVSSAPCVNEIRLRLPLYQCHAQPGTRDTPRLELFDIDLLVSFELRGEPAGLAALDHELAAILLKPCRFAKQGKLLTSPIGLASAMNTFSVDFCERRLKNSSHEKGSAKALLVLRASPLSTVIHGRDAHPGLP